MSVKFLEFMVAHDTERRDLDVPSLVHIDSVKAARPERYDVTSLQLDDKTVVYIRATWAELQKAFEAQGMLLRI